MTPLLLIELNEVNFELVERYVARGGLPTFARLIRDHGYTTTSSEVELEDVEPWIQWVTAHTGQRLAEHRIRRLGDILGADIPQIWEILEERGFTVGAFSPMNAKHRMVDPAFFVPDPWTKTEVTAPPIVARLHAAIAQLVNDNAAAKVEALSLANLLIGFVRYASPSNYPLFLKLAAQSIRSPWARAIFLDVLLTDVFSELCRRRRVDFASLFLNAGAHIQHHYMHSAAVADVTGRNPTWYCPPGSDPVWDVYSAYDRLLARLTRMFSDYRLLIATGLHQVSHDAPTFYWRLKDHAGFLDRVGIRAKKVTPLMSRDFLLEFDTRDRADRAAGRLAMVVTGEGEHFFEVDNRGGSLFVTLSYSHDIGPDMELRIGSQSLRGVREQVAFVAIKNGEHDGLGYFLDTGVSADQARITFPLEELSERILEAFA